MTVANAWDENAPAGTEEANLTDNYLRDHRFDLGERLETMLYGFNASSNAAPENDYGIKLLRFYPQGSSPTYGDNWMYLFGKDVNSKVELHYLDEDNNERQLTSAGSLLLAKHTTSQAFMQNTTAEDGDGGRESQIRVQGKQSGDEVTTLGYLEFAHKGTSNDEQGRFQIVLNDGNDGDSPSAKALTLYADDAANAGDAFIDVANSSIVLDEDNMASDSNVRIATQQSGKAYADTKETVLVTQATTNIFGAWTTNDTTPATLVSGTIYRAAGDGFLSVLAPDLDNGETVQLFTDGNSNPTTLRLSGAQDTNMDVSFTCPIRKDDYCKVISASGGTLTISWLPIGTGGLVD